MSPSSADVRTIAIDGPPGSGVTALAERLASAMGSSLVRDPAHSSPFRDAFARQPQRFAFQAQTYCLLARYRQQVELAQPDLFAPRGAVVDYCFERDRVYAQVILSPSELALYTRIHGLLGGQLRTPDLLVYLTADREVLRSRIRDLRGGPDRVIKLSVIDQLSTAMDDAFLSYAGGPVLVINTSELDFVERPEHLEELTQIIRNTRGGVRHVRPLAADLW